MFVGVAALSLFLIFFIAKHIENLATNILNIKKQIPWFYFKINCLKELFKNVPKNYKWEMTQ